MNKKLQKWILYVIKKNNNSVGFPIIKNKVELNYWGRDKIPEHSSPLITHELMLLEKEEKIVKDERPDGMYYTILPDGHRSFDNWFKKSWHFILYDKNNIYSLLALLLSFTALIVSILR